MKIGIIGCGWLGLRLAEDLLKDFEIFVTTTSENKKEELHSKNYHPKMVRFTDELSDEIKQWEIIGDLNTIIVTIPFSEKKSGTTSLLNRVQNLSSFIGDFKGQIFMMSSTGVYPQIEKDFIEEDLLPENVSSERMIKEKYPKVNILRLAGLMGDERLLSNYNISNLEQPVNHVHYSDICSVIEKMISLKSESKIFNVVAPNHPSKADVINAQKNISVTESIEPEGRKISSAKLISELNFEFKYPDPRFFHL